jgi:hypothetical protein
MRFSYLSLSLFLAPVLVLADYKCDSDFLCYGKCHKGAYDLHTPTYCDEASGELLRDGCNQYCCKFGILSGVGSTFDQICEDNGGTVDPCC